jgi:hypothetical protein
MTREQRLERIKEGKTILRARRQPKSGKWEIVTYTGSTFMVYSFDKFDTRNECEDFITIKVNNQPDKFISDFSVDDPEMVGCYNLKEKYDKLLGLTEKLVNLLDGSDVWVGSSSQNFANERAIKETREFLKSLTGKEAVTV